MLKFLSGRRRKTIRNFHIGIKLIQKLFRFQYAGIKKKTKTVIVE
jgi:hypothetical protein